MFSHAFHVCIVCKDTLLCGGNKEYLSIYLSIYLFQTLKSIDVKAKYIYIAVINMLMNLHFK